MIMPKTGRIIKAISGFYYVSYENRLIECRARGIFKYRGEKPLVGDYAEFEEEEGDRGFIISILPRKNSFLRPAIANIDQLVIVASEQKPKTEAFFIDKISIIAERNNSCVLLCINKADLNSEDELSKIYELTDIVVIHTSAVTGFGLDELKNELRNRCSAFVGNSGVGKSSILNSLDPKLSRKVNDLSEKTWRGRHTTREVELFDLGYGLIADTPGFSMIDIEASLPMKKEELQFDFKEFRPFIPECRFSPCAHLNEPDCAVKEAVSRGLISQSRYESYVKLFDIANQMENMW